MEGFQFIIEKKAFETWKKSGSKVWKNAQNENWAPINGGGVFVRRRTSWWQIFFGYLFQDRLRRNNTEGIDPDWFYIGYP